jgi:hypothetical protein
MYRVEGTLKLHRTPTELVETPVYSSSTLDAPFSSFSLKLRGENLYGRNRDFVSGKCVGENLEALLIENVHSRARSVQLEQMGFF